MELSAYLKTKPPFQLVIMAVLILSLTASCKTSRPPSPNLQLIETGIASWYGPNFHGKLTANGEVYNMNGLTAAHRTLPFDTQVKVENLDNGQSITVRVNDRGPYAKNRIIDLSRGAAEALEMIGPGTARVKLYASNEVLDNAEIKDLKVPHYTIQLGSFQEEQLAYQKSKKLKGARVQKVRVDNKTVYRLYFGLYTQKSNAQKEQKRLAADGWQGFVKQVEN